MRLFPHTALLYIADPMCSWCWGFSPVMESIREKYRDLIHIDLLVGGLRPGNTERFDDQRREYILGHWKAVHERTGQPFNFEFRMEPGFTYDTEPASRAVVTVRAIRPDLVFPIFYDLQRAFYADNRDITRESVLADIASSHGLGQGEFLHSFRHPDMKKQSWQEFERCRELGITGFPSLLGKNGEAYTSLAHGYMPFDTLRPHIEDWMTLTTTRANS